MTKLVMSLARESFDVGGIALSPNSHISNDGITRTPKPPLNNVSLLVKSIRTQKSLIHCRFETSGLARAIADSKADRFVAEHAYMAESFLTARPSEARESLMVNSHVSEADVWKNTRPKVMQFEHRRLVNDENRIATLARSTAYFDRGEALSSPAGKPYWLNLTLAPKAATDRSLTPPTLVFLGDRTWPPNEDAAQRTLKLWPLISAGIPKARLVLVGKPAMGSQPRQLPPDVQDMNFVSDLDGLLSSARALIAPVQTGGGVRVKILEAASIGLPVLGTRAALGSLRDVLPLDEHDDDANLIEGSRAMLMDPQLAKRSGTALFQTNADRWTERAPHTAIHDWLVGQ